MAAADPTRPREAATRSPLAGDTLGPYTLGRELGAGATARVFEAEHRGLGKRVAIKVLFPRGEAGLQRSLREGKAAARVRHPHVVDIFDVGSCDAGVYLVMELIEGGTLASRVPRPGEADIETALAWLLPVISAVGAAHAVGVVHRDLKPSNILAAFDGRGGIVPKVSDFGISKLVEDVSELTGSDGLLGTPAYMAPEQMLDPRTAGPAADQYSIGVLLHLFASGLMPYEADTTLALMNQVVAGEHVPLHVRDPSVPPDLARVIGRALAVSPHDRHASVHALGVALLPFASARTRMLFGPELAHAPPIVEPPATTAPERGATTQDTFDDRAPELPIRATRRPQAEPRRGRARGGWLARTAVAAFAVGAISIGAFVLRGRSSAHEDLGLGAFGANATRPRTSVEGAAQEYRMGMTAMRDSAWEAGLEHFRSATELDPELGAAHLRLAMAIASPEPDARRALTRARVLRDGLSPRDRVFLDALAPLYFASPPDHAAHISILRAGLETFPDDAELTMHLAIALQSGDTWSEAEALADRALALEPGYPDALQTRARARAALGDVDGALAGLTECTARAPLAVGCLRAHANLLAGEGRCEALAPVLRRWSTVDPRAFEPQLMLAGLLAWQRQPWQGVEDAQRQRWRSSAPEDRPTREKKDRVRLALYRAAYGAATAHLDELFAMIEATDVESDTWATEHLLFALETSGDVERATSVAREYLARAAARVPAQGVANNVAIRAIAALRRGGAMGSEEARARAERAIWPDGGDAANRPEVAAQIALVLATNEDEAAAALDDLEAIGAQVPVALAAAHARALALVGRREDAGRVLDAGMRGCDGLSLLFFESAVMAARLAGD